MNTQLWWELSFSHPTKCDSDFDWYLTRGTAECQVSVKNHCHTRWDGRNSTSIMLSIQITWQYREIWSQPVGWYLTLGYASCQVSVTWWDGRNSTCIIVEYSQYRKTWSQLVRIPGPSVHLSLSDTARPSRLHIWKEHWVFFVSVRVFLNSHTNQLGVGWSIDQVGEVVNGSTIRRCGLHWDGMWGYTLLGVIILWYLGLRKDIICYLINYEYSKLMFIKTFFTNGLTVLCRPSLHL